jgi:hypothetical protein
MANTITISPALQIGGNYFVETVITVTDGATTISDKHYFYSANTVSAVYYDDNPDIGIIHMGNHQVTLSNGDYSTLIWNGNTYASIDLLVAAFIADVAQYTA